MSFLYRDKFILRLIKIIFLLILFSYSFSTLKAEVKYITLNVSASGNTEEMAINNALIESLSQVNGSKIEGSVTIKEFENVKQSNSSQDYFYSENYSKDISKFTKGIIENYQIIESDNGNFGEWNVEVSVTIAKYALSNQTKRKRIAVLPFRITDTRSLEVQNKKIDKRRVLGLLNQSLVTYFTQTRKFFVADRDFVDELYIERDFLKNEDVPLAEISKLGNDLGVDLILVGAIEDFNTKSIKKKFESLNKTFVSTKGIVEISYRVIDVATRQIKYANLYLSDSGTDNINADTQMILDAVSEIGNDILFAIYPLRVEKIEGEIIYLGQGGTQINVGDKFGVFRLGDEINDSYTGESLGQIEERIGTAIITSRTSKISSAKLELNDDIYIDSKTELILRNIEEKIEYKTLVSDKIKQKKEEKDEDEDIW